MCTIRKGRTFPRRPTSQSASGPDGQTSHTCLEVSKQLCWGPGERSVLGALPDLELSLPEGGQARERTDVTRALPKAMLAPERQSSNQRHNLTPSSQLPRLDHGKVVPCGPRSLLLTRRHVHPARPPPTSRSESWDIYFVSTQGCCSLFPSFLNR